MRSTVVRVLAAATIAVLAAFGVPSAAFALIGPNAYGQVFAGEAACLACHGDVGGRWQVGQFLQTAHALQGVDAQSPTATLAPARTSTLWPSPTFPGGISFRPADVWIEFAGGDFVSLVRNDGPHTLSTGSTIAPNAGIPPDDHYWFSGISFNPAAKAWSLSGPVGTLGYFQVCGGCHSFGVTRPTDTTYTLASGATAGHATETSCAGLGIQCETCHGTGTAGSSHWTAGVTVVRSRQVLKSQTCGQCHATGTAKEKGYTGRALSSPNGFTTDRKLSDFFDVYGAGFVKTSPSAVPPSITATDAKFYPDGHNKGMTSGYYNEWLLTGHARSLRYQDGSLFNSYANASCLPCHSGEAFLKSIAYSTDPNDITLWKSSVASDTLDIECAVCHQVHGTSGDPLGLRLPAGQLCAKCHTAGIAAGSAVTPGGHLGSTTKELFSGYGLIGVANAKPFMGEAECVDCHMPKTSGGSPSHRFTVMLPGNADAWGVPAGGDSCTPCHKTRSRQELQAALDGWKADLAVSLREAAVALALAESRPASATPGGKLLIDSAATDIAFVQADGSGGVHNYPYAKAGLKKAAYFARAAGASFGKLTATGLDALTGNAAVYGTLKMGDGSAAGGQRVTIQALLGGTSAWATVATVTTGDTGAFSCIVAPKGTTRYRARWTAKDDATAITSGETFVVVGSTTTLKVSAASIGSGGTLGLSGTVAPKHAGLPVQVQYHFGAYSWHALTTRTLDANSSYATSWRAGARGAWDFRVVFGGDASHAGSTSPTVKVQVY